MISFGNFLLIILAAYAFYYAILLTIEFLAVKGPSLTQKTSDKIQFSVAPVIPVQSVVKPEAELKEEAQRDYPIENAFADLEDSQAGYDKNKSENLFSDLGLETITDNTGIEVTEESLEAYFTTPDK